MKNMAPEKYSETYLTEVIFQVRFSPLLQLYTDKKDAAAKFQNIITKEFPELQFEENKKFSIKRDSTGNPVESKTNEEFLTWFFLNDLGKQVALNGKELILSYNGKLYASFEEFLKDVELILTALKQYNLPQIKSIGLRYINQIKLEDDKNWGKYINSNLHLDNEFNKNELIQSINKIDLKIQDYDLTFQFGQFNPEFPNVSSKKDFILDYDCRLINNESFEKIIINLNKMHEIISNRFEQDITEDLRKKMR